ncbi:hypothetical protein Pfo_007537 [Paulownia fortunei]|nr:hypothetical protein Pfo_007537 [Paulownia fortunei]
MGNFRGHVAPGLAFCIIGLWHLFNHTKLHAINPKSYTSLPWFPTSRARYLELYFIMFASFTSIAMELFIMPHRHQPLDHDATIPSNHLHNFEHANISLSIFTYALFAVVLDKLAPPARSALTHMLGAVMLAQELLLFHLHSTDHMGLEGQYHWLLQIVIFTSLATALLSINYSKSFLLSFARSLAVFCQGVWLIVIGYMLYTPRLIPKGCLMSIEDGHYVVNCHGKEALERAKSLANILFSYYVVGMSIFGVLFYLVVMKLHSSKEVEYKYILEADEDNDQDDDVEAQKEETKSFLQIVNLER